MGIKKGSIAVGEDADITIIDPTTEWVYEKDLIESKSTNSPFIGQIMKASISDVLVGGRIVVQEGKVL